MLDDECEQGEPTANLKPKPKKGKPKKSDECRLSDLLTKYASMYFKSQFSQVDIKHVMFACVSQGDHNIELVSSRLTASAIIESVDADVDIDVDVDEADGIDVAQLQPVEAVDVLGWDGSSGMDMLSYAVQSGPHLGTRQSVLAVSSFLHSVKFSHVACLDNNIDCNCLTQAPIQISLTARVASSFALLPLCFFPLQSLSRRPLALRV
jgi:hypothetical protein